MQSHKGLTLWFTGLSGSGKTTVAREVETRLRDRGLRVERLDGDVVREHLTRDLGFSRADRDENIRRSSFVAALLTRNGVITLCCFISPYRRARQEARELIGSFVEIYVNAPLELCEKRDTKGLYARARRGEIAAFTGISDPYEPPESPEVELRTDRESAAESAGKIIAYLEQQGYISPGPADLHLHTTFSDGLLSPAELIAAAREAGLGAVAVTDHDATGGLQPALEAGRKLGLEVIPGIELSALQGDKEVHILGYFIDPGNEDLKATLARIIAARRNRALEMIEKLRALGLDISEKEVRARAKTEYIGRPHLARALLDKGYIKDLKEAFSADYIGRGGRAYVERFKISPARAIALVLGAGGVPVLAHPGFLSDGTALEEQDILPFLSEGLRGLEVYYSRHTLQQVEYYRRLALDQGLLITGGSDWHGREKGRLGSVRLSSCYLEALKKARPALK